MIFLIQVLGNSLPGNRCLIDDDMCRTMIEITNHLCFV